MAQRLALDGGFVRGALLGVLVTGLSACGSSGSAGGDPVEAGAGSGAGSNAGASSGGSAGAPTRPEGGAGSSSGGVTNSAGASGSAGSSGESVPVAPGTTLSIPARGQILSAQALVQQLAGYDPGSLLRCDVANDVRYRAAIDALGGVAWGYNIALLEDQSKPRYYAGVEKLPLEFGLPSAGADSKGAVEIVTSDVVAVTDAAALFYSTTHGLMIAGVESGKPRFHCAAQLPGRVDQFFFHQGHLVVMTKSQDHRKSQLLHFSVQGTELRFVEAVDLGNVSILDSRRFNEKLVFYTSFNPEPSTAVDANTPSGASDQAAAPRTPAAPGRQQHRALRVYRLGDTLEEELYDTLIDSTASEAQLHERIEPDTAVGTKVSEARSFGHSMWASDHYFVVTEQISKTFVSGWRTDNYSVCTESHTVESPYRYCWTEYETRPNPDYTEPDNSGGDRACQGKTLSDCLVDVARVSNKTIQVPVGTKCEDRVHQRWVCDRYEQRSTTYPTFRHEASTQLFIYEYTDDGFVRVDGKVHEVTNSGLSGVAADAQVDVITTSAETYDLAVPGAVQTLYFQNGYLYVISQGVLQVYAMGGGSIVRTATLPVVNETLQASLFSSNRLFLSDFGWSGGADHSTLRVVGLDNPAFPTVEGATHQLPGGHRSILASNAGIFTIGSVQTFMGQTVNALKLGLFSDPYAQETAYLILGTNLKRTWLGEEEAQFFNGASQRLVLPYSGQDEQGKAQQRVGISRVEAASIVSEGAVILPEPAQRVRPLRTADESYLTFAPNSIEWLTPENEEWKAEPVLEYHEPFALYARAKDAEYVELQHLGTRCRLYFAQAGDINQRQNGAYSSEFFCTPYSQAYERRLIFSATNGVEFGDDHSARELTADEVADTTAKIAERPYCLLALELVDNVYIDPEKRPADAEFTCMSPKEYYELRDRLSSARP